MYTNIITSHSQATYVNMSDMSNIVSKIYMKLYSPKFNLHKMGIWMRQFNTNFIEPCVMCPDVSKSKGPFPNGYSDYNLR